MNRTVSKWVTVFWTALCIAALVFGLLPTANVQAATIVVYDATPATLPFNMASVGFQATQTSEIGDLVHLTGTNRELRTITVTMSTWALHSSYPTMDIAGWNHPITINIYNAIPGTPNTLGSLIATHTQTFAIPWRPEADLTCATPTAWRASDGNCYNGYAFNITFNLASLDVILPDDVIIGIAYNTQSYGSSPIGVTGPYNSLNVGVVGTAVTGTDDDVDNIFWNTSTAAWYTDGGAGGVGIFREDTAWAPNGTIPIQITANPDPSSVVYVDNDWSSVAPGIDPDGAGPATEMGYDAFASIQSGITGVAENGFVHVLPGTYIENPTITKALTLQGETLPSSATSALVQGKVTIAAAATVKQLKVTPGVVSGNAAAFAISSSNVTVSDNLVDGMTGAGGTIKGVHIYKGNTPAITNITITRNTFQNLSNATGGADGIMVQGVVSGVVVTQNTITDITGLWANGIEVTPTASAPANPPLNVNIEQNSIDTVNFGPEYMTGAAPYPGMGMTVGYAMVSGSPVPGDSSQVVVFNNSFVDVPVPVLSSDPLHVLNASGNFSNPDPLAVRDLVVGTPYEPMLAYMDYTPWLEYGTDTDLVAPGFQGDFSYLNVDPSTQSGTVGRIQEGVNLVSGSTVNVFPGTYVENITISKPLTLLGPNAAINPNTDVRGAEAIILPSFSNPDPVSATSSAIIYIEVNDVTIRGFTVDGDNPNLTSGVLVGTADVDAIESIASYEGVGQIVVENNIMQNYTYAALDFYNDTDPSATTDNYIRYNKIHNVSSAAGYGIGVLVYNNFYADITNNVLTAVRVGVQTGNFYQANPGTTASISNNSIETTRRGIFHNLAYSAASPFTISGNTFTVLDTPTGTKWDGIMLSSLQGNVNAIVTNNVITATDVTQLTTGYQVWNTPTTALLTISGGSVTGTDYGVWVNNYDGYNSDADNTAIILSGVQISNASLAGVYSLDNPLENHGHTVKATLLNGVVIDDCTTGIWASGAQASITSYGNLIQNNTTGALFDSNAAGMLSNNSLTNNTTSITNTGTTLINASSNWYGTADAAEVAGLISNLVDYTPWLNSGTDTGAAAGFQGDFSYLNVDDDSPQTGTVGRIQEGVNLVSGSIVNVAPGTYAENVLADKYVEIIGAGSGNTAADTIVTTPTTFDSKVGVFQLAASGLSATEPILLQDLRIQPVGQAGISVGRFTEATGVSVSNVSLDNVWVIGTNNNATTEQERGLYVDLTSTIDHLTVTDSAFNNLAYGWYLMKQVSADTSTVSNVVVTNTTFNHNNLKGFYAEKLSDATFTDCTFSENGFSPTGVPSYFLPWMSGVDINLKAGTYQNISFVNPTVTNNGLGGAKEGVGLALKARNDGASYGLFPATLTNVTVTNGTFTGNERGIRIGEPGKNNPTPTNVQIHSNRIVDNVQTYTGTDGTPYGGVINQSTALVDATNNWFGCNEGPNDAAGDCDPISGLVDADPWLVLSAAADPASILPLGTSTISADMLKNSAGATPAGFLPDGILAAYTTPAGGTLTETEAATLDGVLLPTTTFTALAVDQPYQVCTEVDNELLCVNVAVQNVAPVAVDDTATTVEDTALDIPAATLLTNDTDANADVLTLTAVSNPTNGTVSLLAGVVTFTPAANFFGTAGFDYTVSDGVLTDTGHVDVTVTPVNDDPIAVDDSYDVDEDGLLTVAAPGVMLNDLEVDTDNKTVTLVSGVSHGELILLADGSFTYKPEADYFGTDTFVYQLVTYPAIQAAWTDEATVTINVNAVNDAPVIDPIADQSVNELVALSFTATATDIDSTTLTFSLTGAPTGAVITAGGDFTWTPTEDQDGAHTFTVRVCDNSTTPLCDTEEITVTVNEVNVAPVLAAIGPKSVDELAELTFTAIAADADLPAQPLTFSLTGAPTGAAITADGYFTWTPTEAQDGEYTFDVCVSDGALSDCETITVTVSEANVAPVLAAIGDQTVNELVELTFTATANDADLPAQTLTFSLTGAPTGASITAGGDFTWTPTETQDGEYTFEVCVSDGALSDCETITITVSEVNIAPVAPVIDDVEWLARTAHDYLIPAFTDADGNTLTYTATLLDGSDLPAWLSFDPTTFTFSGTPANGDAGAYEITVTASDAEFSVDASFTLTVTVNPIRIFLPIITR